MNYMEFYVLLYDLLLYLSSMQEEFCMLWTLSELI
jgi:hypothetical protein